MAFCGKWTMENQKFVRILKLFELEAKLCINKKSPLIIDQRRFLFESTSDGT